MKLTIKQENFCQAYIETGNASEAYRRSYNALKMKAETIHRKAKELMDNGKVTARIEELRAEHAERHAVTVDSITENLEEDRRLARELGQASAAISANMGIAKLHGLIVDKKEDVTPARSLEQIDARINQLLRDQQEAGTAGTSGGTGDSDLSQQTKPTVPGHGTA